METQMSKKRSVFCALVAACGLVLGATSFSASGPVVERDTGRVLKKDASSFVVKTPRETLEFNDKDSIARVPKNARVGDEVSLKFTRQSEGTRLQSAAIARSRGHGQEAGERGEPLLDDRAFYSAQGEPVHP